MHNPDRIIFAVDFLGAPVNPEQAVETPDLEMVATAARGMTNVFISLQDSRSFDYTGKNIRLVFIDGDHSYRAVKADTELAMLAHHRQGGRMTIVWHDYIHEPTRTRTYTGLVSAGISESCPPTASRSSMSAERCWPTSTPVNIIGDLVIFTVLHCNQSCPYCTNRYGEHSGTLMPHLNRKPVSEDVWAEFLSKLQTRSIRFQGVSPPCTRDFTSSSTRFG